ncbi:MAG: insulinase family protein [Deltaproteobacteria bacterium]|jgi:zinc protease|nr:insulinase family protein [Deltaproteobacteria bacterium]
MLKLKAFIFSGVLLMLGLVFGLAGPSSARASASTEPEIFRLANGLKVVVVQDHRFPLVSLRLYVHAGSTYETPKEAGISHLLEHMVFKGTQKRPQGGLAEAIEKIGGYINAATSFDYTVYLADLPSEHWRVGLDVLEDMAFHPTLDANDLDSEKKVVISELKRGEDDPGNLLFKLLHTAVLRDTPYSRPIIGYEDVINSITRQDIVNYINRHYQPQSSMLLICGDVDPQAVRQEVEALYGPLANNRLVFPPEEMDLAALPAAGPDIEVNTGPWNKVYLGLAFPSVPQMDACSVNLDILAELLGQGNTSYLYRKYKYERQLVDNISLSSHGFERVGLLYLNVVLDADKLEPFWRELVRDLKNINELQFTQQELDRVKLSVEDTMFRSKETLSGLTSKLGYFEFFDNGSRGEKNYLYSLRKAALQDLRGELADIVRPERLTLRVLAPEGGPETPEGTGPSAVSAAPAMPGPAILSEEDLYAILRQEWPTQEAVTKPQAVLTGTGATEVVDLGPGRKLILIPDSTLPYVSASLMFAGSDSMLASDEQGLAALAAALLSKGAGTLSATQYEDYLADRAASLGVTAGRQSFAFNLSFQERFNADMFELLRLTISQPAFLEEELARARNNQLAAIRTAEDQPLSQGFRKLMPYLYGGHPYGYMTLGTEKGVKNFSRKQIVDFWNRQKAEPWVLAVCGTFEREQIIAQARALPEPSTPNRSLDAPGWTDKTDLVIKMPGRNQAHLMLVYPTVPIGHPDAAALDLLQSILSGQSGLLFGELRDKQGLGYSVTAIPWVSQKSGMLIFYIGTEPAKLEQARASFRKVIADLRENPLPVEELDRGKNAMQGEYYRTHQSLGARSSETATFSVLGLPLDTATRQITDAATVTPEQLRDIAAKYLVPELCREVVIEP